MTMSKRSVIAVVAYLILYALAVAHLASVPQFDAGESLAIFFIFGVVFSSVAWIVTIGVAPAEMEVKRPAREFTAVLLYLGLFAISVLGWGFSTFREWIREEPGQSIAIILLKLATMVLIPAMILRVFGYSFRDLFSIHRLGKAGWRATILMAILLFLLQSLLGRGLETLQASQFSPVLIWIAAPFALVWFCIEAGLTEEFLFRLFLQTRASAWLRSEVAGIVVMAALFGLAHAPGYVLRGQHLMEGMQTVPDPLTAAAYSIAVVSPTGLLFGVLWKRTRNLWLLVFLHGWTDLLPNLADFIQMWK